MMNFLCIIPARGGSKGVKNKNILEINGKPLIQYSIESALESKRVFKTVVSTDSEKIALEVNQISDVTVITRPKEYAQDDSPVEDALIHATQTMEDSLNAKVNFIVWLQPNVPIRKKGLIDEVIDKLILEKGDSCVTCYEIDQIPELMKIIDTNGFLQAVRESYPGYRRQAFEKRYLLNGSVTIMNRDDLFNSKGKRTAHCYLGKKVIPFVQSEKKYSLEIDEIEDIEMLNYFMKE